MKLFLVMGYVYILGVSLQNKCENYIDILSIIVNTIAFIGVALLTFCGTTYVYKRQRKDEIQRLQEELHLILNEMGKNFKKIYQLHKDTYTFMQKCRGGIGKTRSALQMLVNFRNEFVFLQKEDYFLNYNQYYPIFAKEVEIKYRTGDTVQLSELGTQLEEIQQMIKQQYDIAFRIRDKMNTIAYLFVEKESMEEMFGISNIESSHIKKIDRMLKNEGMNTDLISDKELCSIEFSYKEDNPFVRQLLLFVESTDNLETKVLKSNIFPKSVQEKYFKLEGYA